jgi:hypothetical protein
LAGEWDTFRALTAGVSGLTTAAATLLASEEVCGYPHDMLKSSIEDAKAGDVNDNNAQRRDDGSK